MGKFGEYWIGLNQAKIICDTKNKSDKMSSFFRGECNTFFIEPDNPSIEELLRCALYNTSYFHEGRHIHDFLTTPALRLLLLERIHESMSVLFSETITKYTHDSLINTIPIPFFTWIHLTECEKKAVIEEWNETEKYNYIAPNYYFEKNTKIEDDPSYFKLLDDVDTSVDIRYLLLSANSRSCYKEIEDNKYNINGFLYSTKSLIEASALVCQFSFILKIYGFETGSKLFEYFICAEAQKNSSVYTNILLLFRQYLIAQDYSVDALFFLTLLSIVISWSFWGIPSDEKSTWYPFLRFNLFIENNLAKGITINDLYNNPLDLFAFWNKKINAHNLPPQSHQSATSKILDGYINELKSTYFGPFSNNVVKYIKMTQNALEYQNNIVVNNPKRFLLPEEYMWYFYENVNIPLDATFSYKIENYRDLLHFNPTEEIHHFFRVAMDIPFINLFPLRKDVILPNESSYILKNEITEQNIIFWAIPDMINGDYLTDKNLIRYIKKQSNLSNNYKIKFI